MRLTIEFYGHTFTLALNRDEDEPEPESEPEFHPEGDVFATTERRPSTEYSDYTPTGFVTSKARR